MAQVDKNEHFPLLKDFYSSIKEGDTANAIAKGTEILNISSHDLRFTVFDDTILHIAIYMRRESIAKEILKKSQNLERLKKQNALGDTILHEAAAANMKSLAMEILKLAPDLLDKGNKHGEKPLFRAAHYGYTEMFELLADVIDIKQLDQKDSHYKRYNGDTILHMTILAEFYDLALKIAERYPGLVLEKDRNKMIGLQLLSSNPSAFKSANNYGLLGRFIYYCVPSTSKDTERKEATGFDVLMDESDDSNNDKRKGPDLHPTCYSTVVRLLTSELRKINGSIWRFLRVWPVMRRIYVQKKRHESAFELAKFLIKRDLSWQYSSSKGGEDVNLTAAKGEVRINIVAEEIRGSSDHTQDIQEETEEIRGSDDHTQDIQEETEDIRGSDDHTQDIQEETEQSGGDPLTSLLLATSKGIVEIVKEILRVYPQAVEHVSYEGQNILHVAIKHRQLEIFKYVRKMEVPLARLVRRIDNNDYTILHHAGRLLEYTGASKLAPALQLQEELRWFNRVKKIIPSHYNMHRHKDVGTAEDVLEKTHEILLKDAQDWLKRTSESCSTVAVLIATVAFAAAYTVPGGSDQETGVPILLRDPFFLAFTVTDVLSLASSLTSVVMFLSILTSPFQLQDFHHSLPRKLTWGFIFLFFAVAATMLAFAATIMLIVHLKKRWTTWLMYTASFLPVSVFAMLQFPWFLASRSTFKFLLKLARKVLPSCFLPRRFRKTTTSSIYKKNR